MFQRRKQLRYQRAVREAIATNHLAVSHALFHTDRTRLDVQLSEFLLQEAGWTFEHFIELLVAGAFDE